METRDDLSRAMREMALELERTVERCGRVVREAARDMGSWASDARPRKPPPPGAAPPPVESIRQLGELRDAGLITEEEFQAKKAELLDRI